MRKWNEFRRVMALALALVLTLGLLPAMSLHTNAAIPGATVQTDPGTAQNWEDIMGTDADGNRYAGRVWVDKSVYQDGDVALLNLHGDADSSFTVDVDQDNGEYFQVVFSALGSSMSTNTSITASRPLDVVLVLDTSTSMTSYSGNKTRLQHMIEAANKLLEDLLQLGDVRVAIVTFNRDSETVIDLDKYTNGVILSTNSYTNTNGGGIIYAKDKDGKALGNDSGYITGTNLQDGIDRGMNILANATNTAGRTPVAIVLADGRANRAVNNNWYTISSANRQSSGDAGIMLSTLLNAAYGRARVEKNYNTDMTVYGVGIDLSSTSNDYIFLNPGAEGASGFNASNTDNDVETAWDAFQTWKEGTTATITTGSGGRRITWTFDHDLPTGSGVTYVDVANNINYVDNYQDVASASLGSAFDKIVTELATGAFNPITSTQMGATGVEDTPLIYADTIGKYMEVRNIQAVQVFGTTYAVTKNADGTYSVAAGTGTNPTTKESWSTTDDLKIQVLDKADGTQQLRIYINQEILPILLDDISVKTENGVTTSTLTVTEYTPLRVYYTVGLDMDILLPNGQVDPAKLDSDYAYVDDVNGTVSFYSNAFGQMNTTDSDSDGMVEQGDAHVGFVPSHNNRFYYHQAHQEIFISATNKDGSPISWEAGEYGVIWNEDLYKVKAMSYADYATISDSDQVYTYVKFYRPTGTGNAAEEVTYLVYTTWGDLKNTVTFYDKVNKLAINGGTAIDVGNVNSVVSDYMSGKDLQNTDMIAILGLQSQRVSRLHNMFQVKASNDTGTAELSYAPEYNNAASDADDIHEHSEVLVWLGNNGKLTLPIAAGLQVTKTVTELAENASANEKFKIAVTIDAEVEAPVVTDGAGNVLTVYSSTISGGKTVVRVPLADGESAVINGLPGGVTYTVTEEGQKKYSYTYTGATATVAGKVVTGVVTNEPIKPGNLYITKEVVHAHPGETFPMDYEFEFEVLFVDADGDPLGNKTFAIENNYDSSITSLTTDIYGVMRGKLKHGETAYIKGIPAGTVVTVKEVNIPASYTATAYNSHNQSGEAFDSDGVVTIVSQANAQVVVTNTYTPNPTSVKLNIEGTKVLNADDVNQLPGGSFDFKVQQLVSGSWVDITGKTAQVTYAAKEDGSKTFTIEDVLAGITYDKAGTYAYQVLEVVGSVPNVTYDRTLYTFTVTVADKDGQLVATVTDLNGSAITGDSYHVTFTNTYNTVPVVIDLLKKVVDTSNNPLTSKAGFQFVAQTAQVDAEGNWSVKPESEGGRTFTVTSDAAGEARMTDVYKAEGTYYYIISEQNTGKAGWTYDETQYQIQVTVTKDALTGKLTADMAVNKVVGQTKTEIQATGDSTKLEFTNTYDPADATVPVGVEALVKKHLNGRQLKEGEFTFAIFADGQVTYDADGVVILTNAIATAQNDADGNVYFDNDSTDSQVGKLTFSQVGTYHYDIVEVKGALGGVAYDSTIYDLVVEVTDQGDGTLKAVYYFEDAVEPQVTFTNTYTAAPTQVVIRGHKTLKVNSGVKSLQAGDYTFALYEGTTELGQVTNDAAGNFKFPAIEYTHADAGKTFTYTVKELSGTIAGVTYDKNEFTVTVTVTDNGDGTLSTTVTGNGAENIAFVNEYNAKPVTVTLPGHKDLTGRTLTAGEFRFALYQADKNFENRNLLSDTITHDAAGDFTLSLGTLGMGKHYFVVKEWIPETKAPGIHYSGAEYHITIDVTDSGKGQMTYTQTVVNPGVPENTSHPIEFINLYRPENGSIDLTGTKQLTGGKPLTAEAYSFSLYAADDQGKPTGEALQTVYNQADGSFTFQDLLFTADDMGTNTFVVRENIPAGATDGKLGTITYDPTVYTVVVTVADAVKDGALEISYTVTNSATGELVFTNVHTPEPITHQLEATKIYEKGLKGNDFQFTLVDADNKTDVNQTKYNNAEGKILFDPITFTAAGTYKFTVKEKTDSIWNFIRPSQAEYEVTVTVVNEDGVLRVSTVNVVNTKNTGEGNLQFVNTYLLEGQDEVILSGTKTVTGDSTAVPAGQFTFGLYNDKGDLLESVKNDASGKFTFSALTFDETDVAVDGESTYVYTVKEIAGDNARYTYDETVYTVTVTVKDNDKGGVEATYAVTKAGADVESISFTNTYTDPTPVTYTPVAQKTYNKTLTGGEFEFTLEGEGYAKQTKTNDATGKVTFDTLSFPEAGTYTFTVKEVAKALGFIQYSKAEHTIVVKVIDTKGVLSIESVTVNGDAEGTIDFVNTYVMDGEGEVTLSGTKTVTGDSTTVNAGEFTFGLYNDKGDLLESVKNDASGKFTFSALTFDETDVAIDGESTYVYTVKEIPGAADVGYTYDKTVYTVTVTVKDDDKGGVEVSHIITADGKEADIAFTNTYTVTGTGKLELTGTKQLAGGKTLEDGAFSFGLYQDGQLVAKASNVGGTFVITKEYTPKELGTYTYTVSEILPAGAMKVDDGSWTLDGVTYDPTVYTVKVTVADNGKGGIDVSSTLVDAEAIAFKNVYTPDPAVVTINVQKVLDNKTDKTVSLAGFEFVIALGKNTYTAESDATGKTGFTVTFDESDIGKEYTFQVYEKNTGIKGMTYDKTVHTITVQVLQNADGSLWTKINGQMSEAAEVTFTNTYEELVTPPLGDEFNLILPIALMLLSVLGMVAVVTLRKKKAA